MRRKNSGNSALSIAFLFLAMLFAFIVSHPGILAALGSIAVLAFVLRNQSKRRLERSAAQRVQALIEAQADNLARRRMQLVRNDAYGKLLIDEWQQEIEYFLEHHVQPKLSPKEARIAQTNRGHWVMFIDKAALEQANSQPAYQSFNDKMTPSEFEIFCAEQLRLSGWTAHVTMQSRDQGVDVIAEKAGKRLVLQCKLYSGPVGNGAVQEITAGRIHERAHFGVVVTNNRYTRPAEQLAATNGILLLHYGDLAKVDTMLTEAS